MNVVVIGATGVIGRNVVPRLVEGAFMVRAIVRGEPGAAWLSALGIDVVQANILDCSSLRQATAACDIAIDLATSIPRPGQGDDYRLNDRIRREGTSNLLNACLESGVSRIIQQSITFLYGDHGAEFVSEDVHVQPPPLAQSAVDMEAKVQASTLEWLILRGGVLYGPGTGREDEWRKLAREHCLLFTGRGTWFLSLIHVVHYARAVVRAIEAAQPVTERDLYGYIAAQIDAPPPVPNGPPALTSLGCTINPSQAEPRLVAALSHVSLGTRAIDSAHSWTPKTQFDRSTTLGDDNTEDDMHGEKIILVTGATGQQGGAVARHLLAHGWRVRALARDRANPAAQALMARGAEVVVGNLEDAGSLDGALHSVYGVFSMQTNWEAGVVAEVRQGLALAHAAQRAEVQHFVYSSVGGAQRKTGIPHFESKGEIEHYVMATGLPYTIVQPVFFMENFNTFNAPTPGDDGILQLAMPLPLDRKLQLITVEDIGAVVAAIFERPAEFLGQSIEIAGDEPTLPHVVASMSKATGRIVRYVPLPLDTVRGFNEDIARMFEWLTGAGYEADISSLRLRFPDLTRFDNWLSNNGWTAEKEFAMPQYT